MKDHLKYMLTAIASCIIMGSALADPSDDASSRKQVANTQEHCVIVETTTSCNQDAVHHRWVWYTKKDDGSISGVDCRGWICGGPEATTCSESIISQC